MAQDVFSGRLSADVRDLVAQADILALGTSNSKEPQRPISARPGYKRPVSATWKPSNTLPDRAGQESRASTHVPEAPSRIGAASPDSTTGAPTPTRRFSGVYEPCCRGSQAFGGLALPTHSRRIGATRLEDGLLGKIRPDSAGHRPSTAPTARRQVRPGSAFSAAIADRTERRQASARGCSSMEPPSSPRFGSRPGTAPPETAHAGAVSFTRPQTATVRQQIDRAPTGASLAGKPRTEGEHWDLHSSGDDEDDLLGDLANESFNLIGKPTGAPAADLARRERLKRLAEDAGVASLTGKCWQPRVWLSLRQDAINKNETYLLPTYLRIVLASTKRAIQQQMYEVQQPPRRSPKLMKVRLEEEATIELREHDDIFSTVDLSEVLRSAPSTKWYANPKHTETWDDHQPPQVGREAAVVTDLHPLNSAVALSKSMPGMPIMLVAEVMEFDENGDIDLRSLSSLGPDDLLLRTDMLRFMEHIKREVRGSNQNNAFKQNNTKDYMKDSSAPFLIRCKGVSILRGPLEEGFPFYKEPTRVDVILMSMAYPRPKIMKVIYRTAQSADWYEDVSQYNSLIERLNLISYIARADIKEEHKGNKPILIMNVPGAYSNSQQPWDAVKTCLKHWKQTFFADFHSFQICCRNRFGPDVKLAGIIRKAINCRPQPAPGLDIDSRITKTTRKKLRLNGANSVLSDPSDDEEEEELVGSEREMHKLVRSVQKENRAALGVGAEHLEQQGEKQKGWTEESIFAFKLEKHRVHKQLAKNRDAERKEMSELMHQSHQSGTLLSQALAMANRIKVDAFGFVPQDHDFISSSDGESREEESSDQIASRPKRRAYSEKAIRRKPKINHSFARFASKSAVSLMDESRGGKSRRKTEARLAEVHARFEKHMQRKAEEEEMLSGLSKKSLAAKAASKMMERTKMNNDTHFEQRTSTSIAGKLGAGEDFDNFFGGTLLEFGGNDAVVGAHSWQGTDGHERPLLSGREWILDRRLNSDAYMDLRSEARQAFQDPEHCFSMPGSPRSAARPTSASSKMNAKPFETALLGEAKEHYHRDTVIPAAGISLAERVAAQIEADKQAEDNSKRPEERPFASKDVQFRRRTLRETIKIYRAHAADNLTQAGLRDVEVATADHEAEVLKLAEQVQQRMAVFAYTRGEGKAKSPWLKKFQS